MPTPTPPTETESPPTVPEGVSGRLAAWSWIPTLYFAEGLPYIVVMTVSVIMYKQMGVSNAKIAFFTSLLYLPWVLKPLWSPLVELLGAKRWWIVAMQLLIGAGLAGVAASLGTDSFFRYSMAAFWLLAFSSATHDIAADGFYMLGLSTHEQAWWVGLRSTFYRAAMLFGQGGLVVIAGLIESGAGSHDVFVTVTPGPQPAAVVTQDLASAPPTAEFGAASAGVGIAPEPQDPAAAAATIDRARQWNLEQGFYEVVEAEQDERTKSAWLTRLEGWIRETFGEARVEAAPESVAGPTTLVTLSAGDLDETHRRVIRFEHVSGDPDMRVVEGGAFVITPENRDAAMAAVVQGDPRDDEPTAATFRVRAGNAVFAWTCVAYLTAGLFLLMGVYHFFALPRPDADRHEAIGSIGGFLKGFFETFVSFLTKPGVGNAIAFLLLYRFSESQLAKLAAPFLLDTEGSGGLSLTTSEVGFIYGVVGLIMLTLGGVLGGFLASRDGASAWLWPMAIAINLPNVVYVLLSYWQPDALWPVAAAVAIEQFGYGFGFAAYLLVMIYVSRGDRKTAHYAICTGFMALGMMIPGMFCGWLQELIGYRHFFVWVLICTIPAFIATAALRIDPQFGKQEEATT
ncbi:muropeptide transporter [Pseudobythopirellula maris]|uniref:Muropeptide transporter n=1 Tax=Pseudobythopirellula maris TaxID=2527991 RepID=A0A5C5ZJA1_9BACT|nr:AmpG family muropeptide MFS transporter [Pseudobythopirellula maris]TWT87258.1 muropeptide transporter [Pseudobythopirellula maris]